MLSANDIAKYFLTLTDEECGDNISNLKLQKLLYYAQGFHLAIYGKPLFDEPIHAWQHGPVVEAIYHRYKKHGANAIPVPKAVDFTKYPKDVRELLEDIYEVYGQYSATKLRNLTHDEPPWKDAEDGAEIPHKAMKQFFETRLA